MFFSLYTLVIVILLLNIFLINKNQTLLYSVIFFNGMLYNNISRSGGSAKVAKALGFASFGLKTSLENILLLTFYY